MRPQGLSQCQVPMTALGIEPETFWLVVWCLSQPPTVCPHLLFYALTAGDGSRQYDLFYDILYLERLIATHLVKFIHFM